jgi:hypothetical protein
VPSVAILPPEPPLPASDRSAEVPPALSAVASDPPPASRSPAQGGVMSTQAARRRTAVIAGTSDE